MCGVAGIFAYHYAAPDIDRDELRRVRDHMRMRGPDGAGEWLSDDGRVALGHRRLSIIDLSDAAAQPMASSDGVVRISYNGEIYNYRELRASLEARGVRFRTQSDTEVLLAMYQQHGDRMFEQLRGMYAFALWDGRRKAMLLARDPYGIKPLYFADDGWTVRVASQVKALLASTRVSRAPEPAGHVGFHLFGSVPEPFTLWLQLRAVPAGSFQWVDGVGPHAPVVHSRVGDAYLPLVADDGSFEERVRDAVRDSVRAHRVADVPVGAFLSAGVDSAVLVACMAADSDAPVVATTLAFEEFRGTRDDEAPIAAAIAKRYGVDHATRVVSESEFRADLPRILDAMDQPSIDGINTWFVAKAARERGLKVAVSGVGGDELFGGYPSFRDVPRWVRALSIPGAVPGLGSLARRASTPLFARSRFGAKAAGMLELGGTWPGAYLLRRGLFMPWELERVMPRETAREGLRRLGWRDVVSRELPAHARTDHARIAALESQLYMRNQLLRDSDWASMAHSLEIRTPLVDFTLLRALAPALARVPAGEGKRLLAGVAQPQLPAEIVARPKTGFSTPIARWLQRSGVGSETTAAPQRGHWSRRFASEIFNACAT